MDGWMDGWIDGWIVDLEAGPFRKAIMVIGRVRPNADATSPAV
jgi:hypothetical protein